MSDSLFKRFWFWLLLLSSAIGFSQVYLTNAPRFAEAGRPVAICAKSDQVPTQMTLTWSGNVPGGEAMMTCDAATGIWSGTIDSSAVLEGELMYTVTADYDDGSQNASPDCTLYISKAFKELTPQPLELTQTILIQKPWNGDKTAFGLFKAPEGPPIGPASIAWDQGHLYVLDTARQRVLSYTQDGKLETVMDVPSELPSDLVIDPSDGSVLVISQLEDMVYCYQNGKLQSTRTLSMKEAFAFPAKFKYDRHTKQLYAHNQNQRDKLVRAEDRRSKANRTAVQTQEIAASIDTDVQDRQILIKTGSNPDIYAINFDHTVGYIDESLVDNNGIVWVLYTQRGDYRIRRLLRLDTVNGTAQTAQIDVWFSFDATRRMTLTDTGVALMAGDTVHGRIVMFDYAGDF